MISLHDVGYFHRQLTGIAVRYRYRTLTTTVWNIIEIERATMRHTNHQRHVSLNHSNPTRFVCIRLSHFIGLCPDRLP